MNIISRSVDLFDKVYFGDSDDLYWCEFKRGLVFVEKSGVGLGRVGWRVVGGDWGQVGGLRGN